MMGNLEDALKQFLADNPDLPPGEEEKIETVEPRRPKDKLVIEIERKGRAGKTATIVSGFTISDDEIAGLARELKTRLGVGGSCRGGEILIQGEHRREITDLLKSKGFRV